jgi:trehalose 6-phosphate phosphatase
VRRDTPKQLKPALENMAEIVGTAHKRHPAFFLDYDGTLTPIVERPELAIMSHEMRDAVRQLAEHGTVAIVSGRALEDVRKLVQLNKLVYAGSHGFEIAGPEGTQITHDVGEQFVTAVDHAEQLLHDELDGIEGVLIERKHVSVAIHVRLVNSKNVSRVEQVVERVAKEQPTLRITSGKKVYELQPNIDWHKGKAVAWLMQALKLEGPDVLPIYIGDDVTDEDAFVALKDTGVGILVSDQPRETAAEYVLRDTGEVEQFLRTVTFLQKGNVL